jgi:two-component system sensor histidine kinase YesM
MLRRLYREVFKKRFFNKILLIYAVISICSIFILSEVILHNFTQILETRELKLNSQILNRVSLYIDTKFRNALTIYQNIYHTDKASNLKTISFFTPQDEKNGNTNLLVKAYLASQLAGDFQLDSDINNIVLKRYSDDSWYIIENSQLVLRDPFQTPEDLTLGVNQINGFVIQKTHDPQYRNASRSIPMMVYTMAAPVMSTNLKNSVGEIYIDFNTAAVKNEYREYLQNLKGYILILTKSGEVIYDSSGRYYGNAYPYFDRLMSGKTEIKLESDSVVNLLHPSQADVIVAGVIPKSEIYTVSGTIRETVYLVSLACLAATLGLSFLSTKITSRRVRTVTEAMRKLRDGDLSIRIAMGREEDELSEIAMSFNHMCDDLQKYISKVYIAEIKQKNAQLNALQSQVNPHFLYNTLESIRMLAITKQAEDAGEMIRLLASLFRSTIRDEMIISVQAEAKYCILYLDLFKIRFGDRLTSDVNMQDGILPCGILKHLLQPAVENYIIHGFEPDRTDNHISIEGARENDDIVFTVSDNGKGISPERLEELRNNLNRVDSGNNIGLPNVNERIKLIYGERYGLDIASEPGKKTIVTIRIMAMSREALREHVQNTDG